MDCLQFNLLLNVVIAQSEAQRNTYWRLREKIPVANRLSGAFVNSEPSVPVSSVGAFVARIAMVLAQIHPNLQTNTYGLICEANTNSNVLPSAGISKAELFALHLDIVKDVRGATNYATLQVDDPIRAEHGIGRLKVADL